MISYKLLCDQGHAFDGWFRNSDDFDMQLARNLLACPVCGSPHVQKGLMAPSVSTARKREQIAAGGAPMEPVAEPPAPQPAAPGPAPQAVPAAPVPVQGALLPNEAQRAELVQAIRELKSKLIASSEDVGKNFADEARKIHYGETEERPIRGEATPDDAQDLLEEGIAVLPLPVLPEDRN